MNGRAQLPTGGHTAPCTVGTLKPLAATVEYSVLPAGGVMVDAVLVADARIEYPWLSDAATDELERQIARHRAAKQAQGGAA